MATIITTPDAAAAVDVTAVMAIRTH